MATLPQGGQVIIWSQQMILLDEDSQDVRGEMAFAAAHLELHEKELKAGLPLTEEHNRRAADLADCWMSWVLEPAVRPEGVGGV